MGRSIPAMYSDLIFKTGRLQCGSQPANILSVWNKVEPFNKAFVPEEENSVLLEFDYSQNRTACLGPYFEMSIG